MFMVLDTMPLDRERGVAVDRKQLPLPDAERRDAEMEFVAPRTPMEELLTKLWSEVLGSSGRLEVVSSPGRGFALAIRLMAIGAKGVNVPLPTLFQQATVAKLAKAVEG